MYVTYYLAVVSRERPPELVTALKGLDLKEADSPEECDILIAHHRDIGRPASGNVSEDKVKSVISRGGIYIGYTNSPDPWEQPERNYFLGSLRELTRKLNQLSSLSDTSQVRLQLEALTAVDELGNAELLSQWGEESAIWHELKHLTAPQDSEKRELKLTLLENAGASERAAQYRSALDKGSWMAVDYAKEQEARSASFGDVASVLAPLSVDQESSHSHGGYAIGVLYVEDHKPWVDRLGSRMESFASAPRSRQSRFNLKHASNRREALMVLLRRGVHAVVLDFRLESGAGTTGNEAFLICDLIRSLRPELPVFGLTSILPESGDSPVTLQARWKVDAIFFKSDPAEIEELLLAIIRSVEKRVWTPFYSALREYSEKPTAVFHALPLSRGKSVAGRQWTADYLDFYGPGYFAAETSSTLPPLDSLFHPKGSLLDARKRAAQDFFADDTWFVPSGTTIANCIIYHAILQPGDVVLLDRNCHRSHHYAAAQSGASVVYLEPEHVNDYGISSIVSLEKILKALRKYRNAKLLALTHPTFDGILYDPRRVIREAHAINLRRTPKIGPGVML